MASIRIMGLAVRSGVSMKRTHYTHWRGYTVYTPQGIPLLSCCAASRQVAEAHLTVMNDVMEHRKYKVRPVVVCHPRHFRVNRKGNK